MGVLTSTPRACFSPTFGLKIFAQVARACYGARRGRGRLCLSSGKVPVDSTGVLVPVSQVIFSLFLWHGCAAGHAWGVLASVSQVIPPWKTHGRVAEHGQGVLDPRLMARECLGARPGRACFWIFTFSYN
ncbi:hypothetical protein JCGZ_27075 [Jatropha curcas]|uniref:Uncharacterized protein n=1 Tax=Jatropha curcas TaxID=180498 RepID=A0A067JJG9_JATCU|nr:hypothetical protein JCGZ_27075 [Jatropha curcas]